MAGGGTPVNKIPYSSTVQLELENCPTQKGRNMQVNFRLLAVKNPRVGNKKNFNKRTETRHVPTTRVVHLRAVPSEDDKEVINT